MSFFSFDNCKTKDNQELFYDYRPTHIYNTDIVEKQNNANVRKSIVENEQNRIINNDKFYKIGVNNKESNFTFKQLNPSTYTATNIYLYGILHNNIPEITTNNDGMVGEIVIEHISSTDSTVKLYTCFLLSQAGNKSKSTTIDKLISNVVSLPKPSNIELDLNIEIPTQHKCFHYKEKNDIKYPAMFGMSGLTTGKTEIFVFTTPIQITNISANLFSTLSYETNLFDINAPISPSCINIQGATTTIEGFDNGAGDITSAINKNTTIITDLSGNVYGTDDSYLECSVVNESDEKVQSTIIPLNDPIVGDLNGYKMFVNFLLFCIICIVSNLAIPSFYKMAVIDNITKDNPGDEATAAYIRGADVMISIIVFIHIIWYLLYGIAYKTYSKLILVSFAIIAFYILGFSLIQYKKLSDDWKIQNLKYPELNFMDTVSSIGNIVSLVGTHIAGHITTLPMIAFLTTLFIIFFKWTLSPEGSTFFNFSTIFLIVPSITVLSPIIYLSIIGMKADDVS